MKLDNVKKLIENSENKNTLKKTLNDVLKFLRFLATEQEYKNIHEIAPDLLDEYIANYILSVKKNDQTEYEPTTIRNMISSIERHLKRNTFPVKMMTVKDSNHFQQTRDALRAKQRSLKKMGKGNKPNAASPVSDSELRILFEKDLLGGKTPKSLLNTLWFNNCTFLGLRGTTDNYNVQVIICNFSAKT